MFPNDVARGLIGKNLVTPCTVEMDGIVGRFDTLRVGLEHLRSHGVLNATLSIHAASGTTTMEGQELADIVDAFEAWPTAPN